MLLLCFRYFPFGLSSHTRKFRKTHPFKKRFQYVLIGQSSLFFNIQECKPKTLFLSNFAHFTWESHSRHTLRAAVPSPLLSAWTGTAIIIWRLQIKPNFPESLWEDEGLGKNGILEPDSVGRGHGGRGIWSPLLQGTETSYTMGVLSQLMSLLLEHHTQTNQPGSSVFVIAVCWEMALESRSIVPLGLTLGTVLFSILL